MCHANEPNSSLDATCHLNVFHHLLDNTKLPLNHRQKLFPNGTLVINELNEISDRGQYSCQAKNLDGQLAKSDVHITIKGKLAASHALQTTLDSPAKQEVFYSIHIGSLSQSRRQLKCKSFIIIL